MNYIRYLSRYLFFFILIFFFSSFKFPQIYAEELITQAEPPKINEEEVIEFTDEEEKEIEVLPPEPVKLPDGTEEKIGITINIPVIGNVTLYPEKDPKTGKEQLRATLPGKKINLSPLPIKVYDFEIILSENDNISLKSTVEAFGKKANFEIVELKKDSIIKEEEVKGTKVKKLNLPIRYAHFLIVFIDKPKITLLPGRSVTINHLDLILEKGKPSILTAESVTAFGNKGKLEFSFGQKSYYKKNGKETDYKKTDQITLSINSTTLGKLVDELEKTPFKDVLVKNISITTQFILDLSDLTKMQKRLSVSLAGEANFSNLKTGNLKLNLKDLKVTGTFTEKGGFRLEAELKNFTIPILGTIENAKFIFDSTNALKARQQAFAFALEQAELEAKAKAAKEGKIADQEVIAAKKRVIEEFKKKAEAEGEILETITAFEQLQPGQELPEPTKPRVSLIGKGSINIPNIGKLNYFLASIYSEKGFELDAIIKSSVSYAGTKIDNAKLKIETKTKTIILSGDAKIKNFDLDVNLLISDDPKDPKQKIVKFEGSVAKDLKPFEKTKLPDFIKKITLSKISVGIDIKRGQTATQGDISLIGDAKIFDIPVHAEVKFIKSAQQEGIFLKAFVPTEKLPGGFKKLKISNSSFIISTINYLDPQTGITITPGVGLTGQVQLDGPLTPIGKWLGGTDKVFAFAGTITPDPKQSKISVALSKGLPSKFKKLSIGPVNIDITGAPEISLIVNINYTPTEKDETLTFKGALAVTQQLIRGDVGMAGTWKNPFGIKGFSIGNIDLGIGFNPKTFPEDPAPSEFQMAGQMGFGKRTITFALKLDLTDMSHSALFGKLDGTISISDMITYFANKMGAKIPENKVPTLDISDVEIRFAPETTIIGPITIPQGVTIKGQMDILKTKVATDFNLDVSGIRSKIDMSPIQFGPLKITAGRTAEGKIRKTKFGGPEMDIELTFEKQIFLISGLVALAELLETSADISISKDGISFNFEGKIGKDLFDVIVKGQSSGPIKDPEFKLYIDFKQKFMEYIKKVLVDALNKAESDMREKINQAINKVENIEKEIEKHKKQMETKQKEVEDAKKKLDDIDNKIKEAERKINEAKEKVENAQKKVDKILSDMRPFEEKISSAHKKVDELQKEIDKTEKKIHELKGIKKIGIPALEAKKLALQASLKTAHGILDAAKKVGEFGKLKVAKKVADEALKVAQNFLEKVTKEVSKETLETAKKTAQATLDAAKSSLDKIQKLDIGTLQAAKKASEEILHAAEKTGVGTLKAGKFIIKSLTEGLNVKEIKFEGSLKELEKQKLPHLFFDVVIAGKEHKLNFDFDFSDVKKSAESLAKFMVNIFH